jgi:hypothetical protein
VREGLPHRTVYASQPERNLQFPDNRVVNSKYTILTFLPLNLYQQFRYGGQLMRVRECFLASSYHASWAISHLPVQFSFLNRSKQRHSHPLTHNQIRAATRRLFMNQYFLLIAILQCFPVLTPVNPLSTWLPLLFIFTVRAVCSQRWFLADEKPNSTS